MEPATVTCPSQHRYGYVQLAACLLATARMFAQPAESPKQLVGWEFASVGSLALWNEQVGSFRLSFHLLSTAATRVWHAVAFP